MWILLDIGNSSTKVGLFDPTAETGATLPGELISSTRIEHTTDARNHLAEICGSERISRVGGVSVVPSRMQFWSEMVRRQAKLDIEFFDETSSLPFSLDYQTPETMGNDRIAVASAGWHRYGSLGHHGVIVVDAGTAINFEIVTSQGRYPGGIITAGPGLMLDALGSGTAQLPQVQLVPPDGRIGRSTEEAIQSGVMFGMLDKVQGMVRHLQAESDMPLEVVVTGGWGSWISSESGYFFEDNLVLKGVSDLMRLSAN